MARVIVKHLSEDESNTIKSSSNDHKRIELAFHFYKNAKYKSVAELELGGSLSSVLKQTLKITNKKCWYENPDILVNPNIKDGCRSTSVGDIIIVAHEVYVVMADEFKHLDLSINSIFAV